MATGITGVGSVMVPVTVSVSEMAAVAAVVMTIGVGSRGVVAVTARVGAGVAEAGGVVASGAVSGVEVGGTGVGVSTAAASTATVGVGRGGKSWGSVALQAVRIRISPKLKLILRNVIINLCRLN
jgi:hypothetical protein